MFEVFIYVASISVVKRERMIQFKFIRANSRRPRVIDFFKEVAADGVKNMIGVSILVKKNYGENLFQMIYYKKKMKDDRPYGLKHLWH